MKEKDFVRIINNSIKEENLLFYFNWIGKLVSINKWHTLIKINNRYLVGVSYAYKKLKKLLIEEIKKFLYKPIYIGKVDMIIKVSRWKIADTGNIEKPIGDALQSKREGAGVIKDDNQIRHIYIIRNYHKRDEDDYLEVRLYKVNEV